MKTTFDYIAISKRRSLKFDTLSYLLNIKEVGRLMKGECLQFGYLTNEIKVGAKRGWFIKPVSMFKEEFDKFYDFVNGKIEVKI